MNGINIRLSLPRLSTNISTLRIIWTPNTEPAPDQFDDEIQISVGRHSIGVVRRYWSEILTFAGVVEASRAKFGPLHAGGTTKGRGFAVPRFRALSV